VSCSGARARATRNRVDLGARSLRRDVTAAHRNARSLRWDGRWSQPIARVHRRGTESGHRLSSRGLPTMRHPESSARCLMSEASRHRCDGKCLSSVGNPRCSVATQLTSAVTSRSTELRQVVSDVGSHLTMARWARVDVATLRCSARSRNNHTRPLRRTRAAATPSSRPLSFSKESPCNLTTPPS
jgi:hypothetical protein